MLAKLVVLSSLLSALNAQATYGNSSGNYSLSWESLPGSIYAASQNWANANWPVENVGQPLVPQTPDEELMEMLEGISIDRTHSLSEHRL